MRIGLDISFLNLPPTGIGAYVEALLAHMGAVDPDVDVVPIAQPRTGFWKRIGPRASRFGWESLAAGIYSRRADIDLLHMPMMARPPLAGVPVVVTVHDVIPYVIPEYGASRPMQVSLALTRQALRYASAVIAPSHHAKADIAQVLGIPAARVHVTHEAADKRFRPATVDERLDRSVPDKYGIRGRYVFNVGGLDVRKNLPTLIRAFHAILHDIDSDLTLVIAGGAHASNPMIYPPLEPLIAELGLEDRVILTGRIPDDDKIALLQRAELYATPTLYEGFGLPVLEAMACGIPVIASNRTSIPEIVEGAGLLVEPRVQPFADGMRSLLKSEVERARLAAAGLERSRQFSWDKTARETIAVYRSVLGKEKSA